MGVPNSRSASLLTRFSLKRQENIRLLTRPTNTTRLLHQQLPFFDPSTSLSIGTSTVECPASSSSSSSSPQSRPASSRSTHSNSSAQTSSTLLNHTAEPDPSHDYYQLSSRSTTSHLSPHNQFSPLNLYGHTHPTQTHQQLESNPSSLLQKKKLFVFRNGASGIPKNRFGSNNNNNNNQNIKSAEEENSTNQMSSVQVGEDSYFLRTDSLGVADGVGGWSGKPGANPGLFSRKLMHHCSTELSRYQDIDDVRFLSYNAIDPVDILQHAFEKSIHESKLEGLLGSTTALIAVLRDDELRIANLGDCCCSVIRGNDFIFRSEEQQHSFNYPVQIGTNSKSTPARDAQRYNIKVQKDDIVILGSDGLADNLFDEDILEEVLKYTTQTNGEQHESGRTSKFSTRFSPQMISESLCLKARTVVEDQEAVTSPFSQRANEEGIHYVGGKNDDISVLVAIVGDQNDA
ncbi:hypothetical protein MJO28_004710 [Puccinia striiformis f. sp. tritici]|uniref:Protein phosphatase n=3 Tax=Puccinia striiformis TaxID=27350 RepID=A0A0L0VMQ4_9BASI|nr:hypothetical protein Pst134EA_008950 [Puccinia striiformis f. sp. tritici]KNF00476.1 hypothetical protein PSTG_06168 [Puccinia striiformis f. sp. tritici PST-78]POW03539.1 hypothetical protein PSTT_11042 [Puccinia striiformis]KAH9457619.1 hypothetical protein Pst134EB_009934 [Puccinia striiformis f. sp. tritici]KAH9457636.1 hypothetical protein Pst134EB_009951 [Puccinia striiformis f. sp. tritici]KAH9468410.1 hypothetical protein Pst134EA_008950 [Puccinia striiformis f. sp. tritici]